MLELGRDGLSQDHSEGQLLAISWYHIQGRLGTRAEAIKDREGQQ